MFSRRLYGHGLNHPERSLAIVAGLLYYVDEVMSMLEQSRELFIKIRKACKKNQIYIILFSILTVALILVIAGVIISFHRQKQFMYWVTNNTGSVADWIGNVSVPIILALFTFRYRTQEKQKRIQNEKDKVFGLILDSNRINEDLKREVVAHNAQEFQRRLNTHIGRLERMRDIALYFNDHATSEPLYSEIGEIVDGSNEKNKDLKWIEGYYMPKLEALNDALKKYYRQLE